MPEATLAARLAADRTAKQAAVLQACQPLGIVPRFERGLEGVYVFDQTGQRLATLRYVPHPVDVCAVTLDVRCERLRDSLESRQAQRTSLRQPDALCPPRTPHRGRSA